MSPVQWKSHVELLQSFSGAVEQAEGSMGLVVGADRTPNLVVMEDKPPATPPSSPQNGKVPNLESTRYLFIKFVFIFRQTHFMKATNLLKFLTLIIY
jgi:hypothetical protein